MPAGTQPAPSTSPAMAHIDKRSSPISLPARNYLLKLIMREDILLSKATDMRTAQLKRDAWTRVGLRFNAAGLDVYKTEQQLMKIWERHKAR